MKASATLYDWILVLSIIALWAAVQLPEDSENVVGYFLVLTVGVGHGANDLKIYFKDQHMNFWRGVRFVAIYALAVLAGFAAFFVIPDLVLALFILVSGFHFGQEHFERYALEKGILPILFYTSYGSAIVLTLLFLKSTASLIIIQELIQSNLSAAYLGYAAIVFSCLTLVLGIILLRTIPMSQLLRELFYLLVLFLIFINSSLLWGFAIYFILWHSVPSIYHQIQHLYGSVSKSTVVRYARASVLYWIAALVFLYLLFTVLNEQTTLFLTIIVAFLGGITFPHVFVMHRIHEE